MELILTALQGFLVPQVVSGLVGGMFGSYVSARQKYELYGLTVCFFFALISTIWAGGVSEYFLYAHGLKYIVIHMGIGCLVGIVGVALVDVVNLAAPDKMAKLIDKTADGFIDKVFFWVKKKGD